MPRAATVPAACRLRCARMPLSRSGSDRSTTAPSARPSDQIGDRETRRAEKVFSAPLTSLGVAGEGECGRGVERCGWEGKTHSSPWWALCLWRGSGLVRAAAWRIIDVQYDDGARCSSSLWSKTFLPCLGPWFILHISDTHYSRGAVQIVQDQWTSEAAWSPSHHHTRSTAVAAVRCAEVCASVCDRLSPLSSDLSPPMALCQCHDSRHLTTEFPIILVSEYRHSRLLRPHRMHMPHIRAPRARIRKHPGPSPPSSRFFSERSSLRSRVRRARAAARARPRWRRPPHGTRTVQTRPRPHASHTQLSHNPD